MYRGDCRCLGCKKVLGTQMPTLMGQVKASETARVLVTGSGWVMLLGQVTVSQKSWH